MEKRAPDISKCQQKGLLLALKNLRDLDINDFFSSGGDYSHDFFLLLPDPRKISNFYGQ